MPNRTGLASPQVNALDEYRAPTGSGAEQTVVNRLTTIRRGMDPKEATLVIL